MARVPKLEGSGVAGAGIDQGAELPATAGSYALVFRNATTQTVRVGALGDVGIEPGYLVYVGSAFGPGGLRARVSRHARLAKKQHWHIDYLRPYLSLEEVWWSMASNNREHAWAERLAHDCDSAHRRFGASDCSCQTHLFYSADRPDRRIIGTTRIWYP